MRVTWATEGAPGGTNEDYLCCGPGWAVILDGATAPAGVDSGCVHPVAWFVRRLAAATVSRLAVGDESPLSDILAAAIKETCGAHAQTCDLGNPDSPSSTISIIRFRGESLDYLVLGDSPIVLWHDGGAFTLVEDDRVARLPGGRPYSRELVRAHRNTAGGFWVASTSQDAAYQALAGTAGQAGVTEAGMFTDGVTRLTDWYGHTWPGVFSLLRREGPAGLISAVRRAEASAPRPHAKRHDDATAVYLRGPWA
jgi:protein phosphatase 2C-like protein